MSCPTGHNSSGLVWPCRNLSGLVATCLALRAGPGVPILKTFRPDAYRLHPSCLQAVSFRLEGLRVGPADLARSTAEGVGGFEILRRIAMCFLANIYPDVFATYQMGQFNMGLVSTLLHKSELV